MNYAKITYTTENKPTRCPNAGAGCTLLAPAQWEFDESKGNDLTFVCNKGQSHKVTCPITDRASMENENGAYAYFSYAEYLKYGSEEKKKYTNLTIGRYDKYTGNYYDVALPDTYATVLSIKEMMVKSLEEERSFKRGD